MHHIRSSLTAALAACLSLVPALALAKAPPPAAAKDAPPAAAKAAPAAAADEDAPEAAVAGDAAPENDEAAAAARAMAELESELHYKTGTITLLDGKVQLNLPEGYRYLGSADTDKVLQAWGNPPDPDTQGMLFPRGAGPFSDDSFAVVIEYNSDGHVDDADAAKIDYTALLAQMRDGAREGNAARKSQGLATVELTGWAEPPHYDSAVKKLYWAKDLQFGDAETHTLNYAVRVLGREGVLELNAVAEIGQLPLVKREMTEVLGFSEFTDGNRYADYKPGVDRSAGYGIAAVVAGGAALKAVGSKGFLALLLGAKKLIVVALIGMAAVFRKLWGRLIGQNSVPPSVG